MSSENQQSVTKDRVTLLSKLWGLRKKLPPETTLAFILVIFFVALSIASNRFFTIENLSNLVRQTSIIGVVAIGMTFVIISGGIDLSVGSVVGFSGVIVAMLLRQGMAILPSVVIAIAAGAGVGLISGVVIYDGNVPAFIATLGAMTTVRGLIMLITRARMVTGLPDSFNYFSQQSFLFLPALFFVWLIVIVISSFIMRNTRYGRNIYAIGSNAEAARLSGINIRRNIYLIYMTCGLTSGIAGVMISSRLGNGIPLAGTGYELDAIAAVVIGGASLFGAEGSIIGTVMGAVLTATLRNGGNLLGINPFILQMAIGILIIVAVLIDQQNKKRR